MGKLISIVRPVFSTLNSIAYSVFNFLIEPIEQFSFNRLTSFTSPF